MAHLTLVELNENRSYVPCYQPHRQGIMVKLKGKKGRPRTSPGAAREKKTCPKQYTTLGRRRRQGESPQSEITSGLPPPFPHSPSSFAHYPSHFIPPANPTPPLSLSLSPVTPRAKPLATSPRSRSFPPSLDLPCPAALPIRPWRPRGSSSGS